MTSAEFQKKLRKAMEERGWTQVQTCEKLQISRSMLNYYLGGHGLPPTVKLDWILAQLGLPSSVSRVPSKLPYNTQSLGERLVWLMNRDGMKESVVALKLGVSVDKLRWIMTGRSMADVSFIHRTARFFDVSEHWLASGIDEAMEDDPKTGYLKPSMTPVISFAQAGKANSYTDMQAALNHTDHWVPNAGNDPNSFAVIIRGDSMEPRFRQGDIAIVSPNRILEQGKLTLLRIRDKGVCIKYCTRTDGKFVLASENSKYPTFKVEPKDVHWAYRVTAVVASLA